MWIVEVWDDTWLYLLLEHESQALKMSYGLIPSHYVRVDLDGGHGSKV